MQSWTHVIIEKLKPLHQQRLGMTSQDLRGLNRPLYSCNNPKIKTAWTQCPFLLFPVWSKLIAIKVIPFRYVLHLQYVPIKAVVVVAGPHTLFQMQWPLSDSDRVGETSSIWDTVKQA